MSPRDRKWQRRVFRKSHLAVSLALLGFVSLSGAALAAQRSQSFHELLETCTACHGPTGNSSDATIPKLAGQKPSYLIAQLEAFRSGARKSDKMSTFAEKLSDHDIQNLARYFSRQRVTSDHVGDERLAALGRRIYLSGDRRVPSCAACHDPRSRGGYGMMMGGRGGRMGMGGMGGMMRSVADAPKLAGQHATYIVQQLDAFASGARSATVMGAIADRLDEHERRGVAAYISGLD